MKPSFRYPSIRETQQTSAGLHRDRQKNRKGRADFIYISVCEVSGSPQARHIPGDEILLGGRQKVSHFGSIPLFPFGIEKEEEERQVAQRLAPRMDRRGRTHQVHTGNLYVKNSPAATNSSTRPSVVLDERRFQYEGLVGELTRRDSTVLFEL